MTCRCRDRQQRLALRRHSSHRRRLGMPSRLQASPSATASTNCCRQSTAAAAKLPIRLPGLPAAPSGGGAPVAGLEGVDSPTRSPLEGLLHRRQAGQQPSLGPRQPSCPCGCSWAGGRCNAAAAWSAEGTPEASSAAELRRCGGSPVSGTINIGTAMRIPAVHTALLSSLPTLWAALSQIQTLVSTGCR